MYKSTILHHLPHKVKSESSVSEKVSYPIMHLSLQSTRWQHSRSLALGKSATDRGKSASQSGERKVDFILKKPEHT